jgi:hypothetical protein
MSLIVRCILISLLVVGCSNDGPPCEETNDLAIKPGFSIGPYSLGMTETELLEVLCDEHKKVKESSIWSDNIKTLYFIQNMSFIIKNKRLRELNVWGTFKGSYDDLGVDYDRESLEAYGEVIKYKGEYRILDIPGISFGFEDGDVGKYIKIF